jgi:hypothetical protein
VVRDAVGAIIGLRDRHREQLTLPAQLGIELRDLPVGGFFFDLAYPAISSLLLLRSVHCNDSGAAASGWHGAKIAAA